LIEQPIAQEEDQQKFGDVLFVIKLYNLAGELKKEGFINYNVLIKSMYLYK